jgi:hypothetical protein
MRSSDPLVRGEILAGQFSYHVLGNSGPPMVHITRSYRPEIVLFGEAQSFRLPMVLEAGRRILINGLDETQVHVTRFAPGEEDQKRVVSNRVDHVIRAIVELGGTYPDVVEALASAKQSGALPSRLAFDAIPTSERQYQRASAADEATEGGSFRVANPIPDLFGRTPSVAPESPAEE